MCEHVGSLGPPLRGVVVWIAWSKGCSQTKRKTNHMKVLNGSCSMVHFMHWSNTWYHRIPEFWHNIVAVQGKKFSALPLVFVQVMQQIGKDM